MLWTSGSQPWLHIRTPGELGDPREAWKPQGSLMPWVPGPEIVSIRSGGLGLITFERFPGHYDMKPGPSTLC